VFFRITFTHIGRMYCSRYLWYTYYVPTLPPEVARAVQDTVNTLHEATLVKEVDEFELPSIEEHLIRAQVKDAVALAQRLKVQDVDSWDHVVLHLDSIINSFELSIGQANFLKAYVNEYKAAKRWVDEGESNICFEWLSDNINKYQRYISDNCACRLLQLLIDPPPNPRISISK
jgi:hypothetical protein